MYFCFILFASPSRISKYLSVRVFILSYRLLSLTYFNHFCSIFYSKLANLYKCFIIHVNVALYFFLKSAFNPNQWNLYCCKFFVSKFPVDFLKCFHSSTESPLYFIQSHVLYASLNIFIIADIKSFSAKFVHLNYLRVR